MTDTYDTDKQTGFDGETSTLYLYFKDASAIEAGKPYIIKWAADNNNIENPVFNNVTISYVINPVASIDGTLVFHGNYGSYSTDGADNTMLYLGADNKLYYPSSAMTIGSCRAYFTLYGITAGEPNSPEQAPVRAFVLNIGDEANGITTRITTTNYTNYNDAWYTLDGRRLSGKPSQRGVYINNRSKVVIK